VERRTLVFSLPPSSRLRHRRECTRGGIVRRAAERDEIELARKGRCMPATRCTERADADCTHTHTHTHTHTYVKFYARIFQHCVPLLCARNRVQTCARTRASVYACGISRRTLINNLIEERACFGPAERIRNALIKTNARTHARRGPRGFRENDGIATRTPGGAAKILPPALPCITLYFNPPFTRETPRRQARYYLSSVPLPAHGLVGMRARRNLAGARIERLIDGSSGADGLPLLR